MPQTLLLRSKSAWDRLIQLESDVKEQITKHLSALDQPFKVVTWSALTLTKDELNVIGVILEDDGVKVVIKQASTENHISMDSETWSTSDLCSILESLQRKLKVN